MLKRVVLPAFGLPAMATASVWPDFITAYLAGDVLVVRAPDSAPAFRRAALTRGRSDGFGRKTVRGLPVPFRHGRGREYAGGDTPVPKARSPPPPPRPGAGKGCSHGCVSAPDLPAWR